MVNTFLPFRDFVKVAKCLDRQRLGKQRLECKQIINLLEYIDKCKYSDEIKGELILDHKFRQTLFYKGQSPFETKAQYFDDSEKNKGKKPRKIAWINHPAIKMWVGYTLALKEYYNIMITEWIERGYKNTMQLYEIKEDIIYPWWIDWEMLHYSHQASLNRKDPNYYHFEIPNEYTKYTYIWPCNLTDHKVKKLKKNLNHYSLERLTTLIED